MSQVPQFDASFHCALPVIRKEYDEDGNELILTIETCDEMVFVSYSEDTYLEREGEADGCGRHWKVVCANGHVLLVPDHEGDDNFTSIPFNWERAVEALSGAPREMLR